MSRAYRAVTGYREPFKREVLSLCEAMARHLVVQRHAIRYVITIDSCGSFYFLLHLATNIC